MVADARKIATIGVGRNIGNERLPLNHIFNDGGNTAHELGDSAGGDDDGQDLADGISKIYSIAVEFALGTAGKKCVKRHVAAFFADGFARNGEARGIHRLFSLSADGIIAKYTVFVKGEKRTGATMVTSMNPETVDKPCTIFFSFWLLPFFPKHGMM